MPNTNKLLSGIILMIINCLAISISYIVAKKLTAVFHPEQVAFLYKASVLIIILPFYFKGGIVRNIKTTRIRLHFIRATFSIAGNIAFYYGLQNIEAVDAAAITYFEQVIILLIGIIYFKENVTLAKVLLIISGLTGALIITKPGFNSFNANYMYLFAALIFWAMNNLSIKLLGKSERTKIQLFYVTFFGSVLSFPLAMQHDWSFFNLIHLKYVVILALLHMIHIVCFFKAFKFADLSIVMPFEYSRLIFTGILGYIFLNEVPDVYSITGYSFIICGGIYLIYSETKKIKQNALYYNFSNKKK